ncbi:MAG: RNA polymerase factor sigma-54 [Candidatus Stygibacter australis]|nr:RNA polymerase factor sigma-54 [Candidatus Stygibacter australis]MDP8321872.1 RNA polymerase factor sigma-54 [Candidatus Stygibacter australis]
MSKIGLHHNLHQKQTQQLLIKPKMLQSLEILAAPIIELETFLLQELQKNPMLELVEEDPEEEAENNREESVEEKPEVKEESAEDQEIRELMEETRELSEVLDSWQEYNGDQQNKLRNDEDLDFEKRYESNRNMITQSNEKDKYLDQLQYLTFNDLELEYTEELIESVNAHGYLPEGIDIYELAAEYGITYERADEIHEMVLNLQPKGITARNITECLQVQLDKEDEYYDVLYQLLAEDFDDLIHKRYRKISVKYGVMERTVLNWKEMISHLDPKPGLRILPANTDYVTPDVVIKRIGDRFEIISNDYSFPRVHLSRNYLNVLNMVKEDRKALEFVRDKINAAKFIMKSVYLRGRTLENVVRAIIKHQPEFFYEENGTLRPLTYSVIANELGVNESTISRVVRSKYAETPFGMMCLKDFFTSKAGKDENYNSVSRQSVEVRIKEYIDNEDPKNPISDLDLAEKLHDEGLTVSRRVVAKYRKRMGILNSHLRRKE